MAHPPPAITPGYASHALRTAPSYPTFSHGSSVLRLEACAQAGPSSRAHATGSALPDPLPACPHPGYPYSPSGHALHPLLAYAAPAHPSNTASFAPYLSSPQHSAYPQPQPQPSSSALTLDLDAYAYRPHDMARTLAPPPPPPRRESVDSSASAEPYSPPPPDPDSAASDRKHACWMCHKAFDRPSTLRKHLLVHTGEKAFQCTTCGRRFSVQSNLNRHAKKCGARLAAARAPPASTSTSTPAAAAAPPTAPPAADADALAASQTTFAVAPPAAPSDTAPPPPPPSTARGRKRASVSSSSSSSSSATPTPTAPATAPTSTSADGRRKRRRRAPSPSRWVPESLRPFDLTPYAKATPVPLPPVAPFHDTRNRVCVWEERDSYDRAAAASSAPYHPRGWRGRLPGPALLEREANQAGGTVLVF